MITIKLRDQTDPSIESYNAILSGYCKAGDVDEFPFFTTNKDNQDWLDDINNNPASPQAHLKPHGRDLTLAELCIIFPLYTMAGQLQLDIKYGRTSENVSNQIYKFICRHHTAIDYVKDLQSLCKYISAVPDAHIELLNDKIGKSSDQYPDHMKKNIIEGTIGELSTYSPENVATVFAHVDSPKFLQAQRYYIDPTYNPLAINHDGLNVMGIPLLRAGKEGADKLLKDYDAATEIGCRESFASYVLQHYAGAVKLQSVTLASKDEADRVLKAMGPPENMNSTPLSNYQKVNAWLSVNFPQPETNISTTPPKP